MDERPRRSWEDQLVSRGDRVVYVTVTVAIIVITGLLVVVLF